MIIKGEYKFIKDDETIMSGENLITLLGESFFMHRWINDEFEPMQYIVLGKGTSRPVKSDRELGKQTSIKQCNCNADLKNKKVTLSCDVTANEILETSEIGVSNGDILISHDIYEPISSEILEGDNTSTIHIEYCFNVATGGVRRGWKPSSNIPGSYYIYEPATVTGVTEGTTGNGYMKIDNQELVNGSYHYDVNSKNLYIKPLTDKNPDELEMIILTR